MTTRMFSPPLRLVLFSLFLALVCTGTVLSGTVYLTDGSGSDSILITSGTGTEFELRLMADAELANFHMYRVHISFDKLILDTVFINDDLSLFRNLGEGFVVFSKYLRSDSTILRIESMIFGAGLHVDGPGLLATIRLRAIGTGIAHLDIVETEVRDVNNNLMSVGSRGVTAFINAPPSNFDLLNPSFQEEFFLPLEDSLRFKWAASHSPYPGDAVRYRLYYGSDPGFSPLYTRVVPNLSDTFVSIPATILTAGQCYWKVNAYNSYDSIWSNQADWYCTLGIASFPTTFTLISPANKANVFLIYTDTFAFSWLSSWTTNPDDYIRYELLYGTSSSFDPAHTHNISDLSDTSLVLPASQLMEGSRYYWKVKAYNKLGYVTWCLQTAWYFNLIVAANPGIFSLLEPGSGVEYNLNGKNGIHFSWTESVSTIPNDTITYTLYFGPNAVLPGSAIYDTSVVSLLELTVPPDRLGRRIWHYWRGMAANRLGFDTLSANTGHFRTYYRGDVDGNDNFNILDVAYLVSYLYKGGPAPVPFIAGDPSCNDAVNILDVSYLIGYLYKGGPAPCSD